MFRVLRPRLWRTRTGLGCFLLILLSTTILKILYVKVQDKDRNYIVNLPYVTVHIDLKGAPPKLEYLASILPLLKRNGANSLLLEYEDMFPYEDKIFNLSARNRYEKKELKEFLGLATSIGFEIIPLVQTFGHLEFALKLQEFQDLREDVDFLDSLCPSNNKSLELVENMITQVMNFHREIAPLKHIHLGCDEVFTINKCAKCQKRKLPNVDLFLEHVEKVTRIVETISPNTEILIWDDMMRKNKNKINWKHMKFYDSINPVYWEYSPEALISYPSLYQYQKKFKSVWISTAFKGADGNIKTFPDLSLRFQNHLTWMRLMQNLRFHVNDKEKDYTFKGIILTGWSRYSHMDPLVEILPLSIPSLVICLITVDTFKEIPLRKFEDWMTVFKKYVQKKFFKELNCDESTFKKFKCNYDGYNIFNNVREVTDYTKRITDYFHNETQGLYPKYPYLNACYFHKIRLKKTLLWSSKALNKLSSYKKGLTNILSNYYDGTVLEEYINLKIGNSRSIILDFLKRTEMCKNVTFWSRGPVKLPKE